MGILSIFSLISQISVGRNERAKDSLKLYAARSRHNNLVPFRFSCYVADHKHYAKSVITREGK